MAEASATAAADAAAPVTPIDDDRSAVLSSLGQMVRMGARGSSSDHMRARPSSDAVSKRRPLWCDRTWRRGIGELDKDEGTNVLGVGGVVMRLVVLLLLLVLPLPRLVVDKG